MTAHRCFFADWKRAGACEGRLVMAHLIPKQTIRREFPKGAVRIEGVWQRPVEALFLPDELDPPRRTLRELQQDPRVWVPMCGGLVGIGGHHGMFDGLRLRIERAMLPESLEEYAAETGLGWYLDRTFGPRIEEAA